MNHLFNGMIALLVSTSFWPTSMAHSAVTNPDTGPGCGLGRQLWEDWKGKKQIAPQLFMASTNVTGSYTFAITSGTSGCSNDGTIWDSQKAGLFLEINYANVMDDMARGGGEHLASMATLMGVSEGKQPEFFAMTQERYVSLVNAGEASPVAMVKALNDVVVSYPASTTVASE
ncbi:MAG: DUF3015 family protein [Nitrospira sp.]|nr:DUF3015 family protein [Nitrospira sp.]